MPLFSTEELDCVTPKEREVFEQFQDYILDFFKGKVEIDNLRQATAACGVLAKKIHGRTAMALIKHDRERAGTLPQGGRVGGRIEYRE